MTSPKSHCDILAHVHKYNMSKNGKLSKWPSIRDSLNKLRLIHSMKLNVAIKETEMYMQGWYTLRITNCLS